MKFYHTEGCPICKVAKAKLDAKNIQYEDIILTIGDEAFNKFVAMGIRQMPVLEDGEQTFSGATVSKYINTL